MENIVYLKLNVEAMIKIHFSKIGNQNFAFQSRKYNTLFHQDLNSFVTERKLTVAL